MPDCVSKQHENILIQACKTNKYTSSKLSDDSMRRSAIKTVYKKALSEHLPEIFGLSEQNTDIILQIESTKECNEESQDVVTAISADEENDSLPLIDIREVAANALNIHNKIANELQSLKVITTSTTDPQANLEEVLDNFIRNSDELSGISESTKAILLAQEPKDVDDLDSALNLKLEDISWKTAIALDQLPTLLFAPKSQEIKQIDAPQMNNLLGFEPSNNLLIENSILSGGDNTTAEVTP